ncbi:MAG: hypothetical protein Terrestrivirus3_61 [Terrestrivirus sp.]|uniref:Uncharacterized protein n=1 Tax=Terrestrivirus sp. TaxID=2487775 RepID=A0A3G4ZLQ8_9VIRU|nr:MAG: hypothetical protein Terrestrivirus3_61 [Terrestrivirus sp.]
MSEIISENIMTGIIDKENYIINKKMDELNDINGANKELFKYIKYWLYAIIIITIIFLCFHVISSNYWDYVIYPVYSTYDVDCGQNNQYSKWMIKNTPAYPPPLINFID